jgi:hypothetical protein
MGRPDASTVRAVAAVALSGSCSTVVTEVPDLETGRNLTESVPVSLQNPAACEELPVPTGVYRADPQITAVRIIRGMPLDFGLEPAGVGTEVVKSPGPYERTSTDTAVDRFHDVDITALRAAP